MKPFRILSLSSASPVLALALTLACALSPALSRAEDSNDGQILILKGGIVLPLDAVQIAEGRVTVAKDIPGFTTSQSFPAETVDRVAGAEPAAFRQAVAELLLGTPEHAIALVKPILEQQRPTAAMPGNFWVEAMRLNILAHALANRTSKLDELAKDLSQTAKKEASGDATAELAQLIIAPGANKGEARAKSFRSFVNELRPAELNGIALYFAADALGKARKDDDALDAFISVQSLYPTAGPSVVAACEYRSAELILKLNRNPEQPETKTSSKSEALAGFQSAAEYGAGTAIAKLAEEKVKSLK